MLRRSRLFDSLRSLRANGNEGISELERVTLAHLGEVLRRVDDTQKTYQLFVGETEVTLSGPALRGVANKKRKLEKGAPLRVRVVVSELCHKADKPLRWVLLTNVIDTAQTIALPPSPHDAQYPQHTHRTRCCILKTGQVRRYRTAADHFEE